MNLVGAPAWCLVLLAILLVAAGLQDLARLKISNLFVLAVAALAVVAAVVMGPGWGLWQNLVVGAFLLVAGLPMFAAGKLGGGDVKLFAASGLWFDLLHGFYMVLAVLLAGGVLAATLITVRMIAGKPRRTRTHPLVARGAGIPYGVAIAAGVLLSVAVQRGLFGIG